MTTLPDFIAYNHAANQKWLSYLTSSEYKCSDQVIRLYSHIANAQRIWMQRIQGVPTTVGVWEVRSLEELKKDDLLFYQEAKSFAGQGNLERVVRYSNSKGDMFENSSQDILLHVCNHGSYHRGQVAQLVRLEGGEPQATDYIFYKRQGF